MSYEFRVSTKIVLDEGKQQDIIDDIQDLSKKHKLGPFISGLIKYIWDKPGFAKELQNKILGNEVSVTPSRDKFFFDVKQRISELEDKLDKLNDISVQLLACQSMGNKLGLERKIENQVLSSFILKNQVEKLQKELGLNSDLKFKNDVDNVKEFADNIVEYIIQTYVKEFEALKSLVAEKIEVKVVSNNGEVKAYTENKEVSVIREREEVTEKRIKPVHEVKEEVKQEIKKEPIKEVKKEKKEVFKEVDLLGSNSSGFTDDVSFLDMFCGS